MNILYLINPERLLILCLGLSFFGCGGGSSGASSSDSSPAQIGNQVLLTVDGGPAGLSVINQLYTSVTLCVSGTNNCQTIDHVLVDTGSYGARFIASVIHPSLLSALPAVSDSSGRGYYECTQFVDGYAWGPLLMADVRMSGELAKNIPVQIIDAVGTQAVPSSCSLTGPAENTVQGLGANGILGVGPFVADCGQRCANTVNNGLYYSCSAGSCSASTSPQDNQVRNPVAAFASDNNGTLITLPGVDPNGTTQLSGTLTFGIGTQSNNTVSNATVLILNSNGELDASVNGVAYPDSFLDSGSNGTFLGTDLFPACLISLGFYCPATSQVLTGMLQGMNGANTAISMTITNADAWFQTYPAYASAPGLAGTNPMGGVDWGLPIYYGHTVYTALDGMATTAGAGPWTAIR